MKKILSIILIIFMMFSIGTMTVACNDATENNSSQTQEMTDAEKVRMAVIGQGSREYFFRKIGGNELQSSKATITNFDWSDDKTICTVSGKMEMRDIYGTVWKNNFDCVVTYSESNDKWEAGSFKYKSDYWSKN